MSGKRFTFYMILTIVLAAGFSYMCAMGIQLYQEVMDKTDAYKFLALGFGLATLAFFLMNFFYYRNNTKITFLKDYKRSWVNSGGIGLILAFVVWFGGITLFTAGVARTINTHIGNDQIIESHEAYIYDIYGYTTTPNPNRPLEVIYNYNIAFQYIDEDNLAQYVTMESAISSPIVNSVYNEYIPPQINDQITYEIHAGSLGIKWHKVKRIY